MKSYIINVPVEYTSILAQMNNLKKNMSFTLLEKDLKGNNAEAKITVEETWDLILMGMMLERERSKQESLKHDLQDTTKIEVNIPGGFLLVCKHYELSPANLLSYFAGDLCHHPIINNGESSKILAIKYFKDANCIYSDEEVDPNIFSVLEVVQQDLAPKMTDMENFKTLYAKELERINHIIETN